MKFRPVLVALLLVQVLGLGCALVDYPLIEDTRGDYQGVIRTAHKAYIVPSFTAATVYPDGSDEIFWMVYQNSYGDQKLYTFNNFDPSGAVNFLDQTYCDWKFDDCALSVAFNPVQNDDPFDYEFFEDCSGFRSLLTIVGLSGFQRIGECGDHAPFTGDIQAMAHVLANLDEITWRAEKAYHLPLDATRFSATLESMDGVETAVPLFGRFDLVVTEDLQYVIPMTPNARHQLNWLRQWAAESGPSGTLRYDYQGFRNEMPLRFIGENLAHSAGRF